MLSLILLLAVLAFGAAENGNGSQPKIPSEVEALASARMITIEPNNVINATMNKPDGSEYKAGEKIWFTVRIKNPGYLYILDMPQSGNITQLFPNYYQRTNFLNPGTYRIPSTNNYSYTVSGSKPGIELVQFILSSKPVDFLDKANVSSKEPFANVGGTENQALVAFKTNLIKSIVVVPEKWTAWTYFYYNTGEENTSSLTVQSVPPGARINVDGRMNGITPARFNVAPGYHDVTLSMGGYQTWNGSVFIGVGEAKSINIPLVPIQPNLTGTLRIRVFPSNSTVYVDGKRVGTGDQTLQVSTGYHRVVVQRDGYQTYYNDAVVVSANRETNITVRLETFKGTFYLSSQPYVSVYIDGVYAGGTGYNGVLYLSGVPVGYHELKLSKEWYVTQKTDYRVRPGDNYLNVNLSQAGMLKVSSNVYPISLTVDGQDYGTIDDQNEGMYVPVGSHSVELTNPEYQPYISTMNFNFQQTSNIRISLGLKPLNISMVAAPNPFSPNGDWIDDTTDFRVNLSRSGDLEVRVYAGDKMVWYRNVNAEYGNNNVIWDGNSLDGQAMPNGVYRVVATVNSYGETMSATTNVVIDKSVYTYFKEIVLGVGLLAVVGILLLIFGQ